MNLEKQIEKIISRNKKVEIDKKWETSFTRKFLISILTYFVIVLFFFYSWLWKPFVNAIVPTIWFLLSTFSMNFFKQIWLKYIYKE